MCCLLPAMTQERLDNQREVVKNERRQGIDNQPYGLVEERMDAAMYPAHHPYSWPVIGHMDDLTSASKPDVENFFKEYYTPNNCTLVIAGDIDVAKTKAMVEKYFGPIPPGPPVGRMKEWVPELQREVRLNMDDQAPLPRLYIAWHSPARFSSGEANLDLLSSIMGRGKTSRLYKRLVYDLKLAQDVSVGNPAQEIGGKFTITVTAAPGKTLDEIEPLVWEEVEKVSAPPSEEEVDRARTSLLAGLLRGLERIGGFGGKSDLLANYQTFLGDTNFLEKDFARYYAVTPATIHAAARRWLHEGRAVMRVTPMPKYAAGNEAAGFDRSKTPALGEAAISPARVPTRLSNGLEVVVAESHKVPAVQLNLIVRMAISRPENRSSAFRPSPPPCRPEGTATRSALQISDEAERLGAQIDAGSFLDSATVSLNALKSRLEPSIALWADVVLNPSFPDAEIERKRQQTLGRIFFEKGDPGARGAHHANFALRRRPPYAQPLTGSGTPESVKAFTRDDLVNYHRAWFKPNNATLVVTGDTTLKEITPLLEKAFAVEAGRDAENRRPAARTAEADGRLYDRQARSGAIGHHRRPPARSAQRPGHHAIRSSQRHPRRPVHVALKHEPARREGLHLRRGDVPVHGQRARPPGRVRARADGRDEGVTPRTDEGVARDSRRAAPDDGRGEIRAEQPDDVAAGPIRDGGRYRRQDRRHSDLRPAGRLLLKYPAAVKATTPEALTALAKTGAARANDPARRRRPRRDRAEDQGAEFGPDQLH